MNKNFLVPSTIWILNSIKPSKILFCLIGLLFLHLHVIAAKPKSNQAKQIQQHNALKLKQSVYMGLDTLFCSGKPVAIAHRLVNVNNQERYELLAFSDKHRAMLIDSSQNIPKQTLYNFQFPSLAMSCSALKKPTWFNVASAVCQYQLMTPYGIDTTRAELFLTLNGTSAKQIPLKVDSVQVPYEKRYIVKRNLQAPLTYSEDQVAQDGQLIARWEENIVQSPQGDLLQLTIINSLGADIATASRGKILNSQGTYTWHILTHKDLKFHSTELKSEGELGELLQFLIQKQYL
jgi:hypothetical protein